MLKSSVPKEGSTKDGEFSAILTLAATFWDSSHKKTNKHVITLSPPSSFGARLKRAEWKATLSHCLKSRLSGTWKLLLGAARHLARAATEPLSCFSPWKDAVNVSSVNLPLSANPLEEGGTCLCCSENALQWCRLVFFQQERGRRSPTHRPGATSSSACTGEGGEDENTGAH